MKRIKKLIAPLILSFLLLGTFFVGSSQNANAKGIIIVIDIGSQHGFQRCTPGGLICVTISINLAVADIVGDAVLDPNNLTLTFAPNKQLAAIPDGDRNIVIDQDVQLDPDLCNYFGVPSATVKAGSYPIHVDDCSATVALTLQH